MDRIDLKILDLLQVDARPPMTELADRAGITKTPCTNRVKRLEDREFITGYSADLNAYALGAGYSVIVQVKLENTRHNTLAEFADAVRKAPEIQSCFMVGGGFDYLLKIRCTDVDTHRDLLGDVVAFLPGIQSSSTFVVLDVVKDEKRVPINID